MFRRLRQEVIGGCEQRRRWRVINGADVVVMCRKKVAGEEGET